MYYNRQVKKLLPFTKSNDSNQIGSVTMSRMLGTVSMGVRAPIIREGDDLAKIVTGSILDAIREDGLTPHDRDIVAMTESIVARAQENYLTIDDIPYYKSGDYAIELPDGTVVDENGMITDWDGEEDAQKELAGIAAQLEEILSENLSVSVKVFLYR